MSYCLAISRCARPSRPPTSSVTSPPSRRSSPLRKDGGPTAVSPPATCSPPHSMAPSLTGRHDRGLPTGPAAGQAVGVRRDAAGGPVRLRAAAGPAAAIGVLRAAVAAGIDHIDTAQYYGPGTVN